MAIHIELNAPGARCNKTALLYERPPALRKIYLSHSLNPSLILSVHQRCDTFRIIGRRYREKEENAPERRDLPIIDVGIRVQLDDAIGLSVIVIIHMCVNE